MAFLFFPEQAKVLIEQDVFDVDMSFKRVKDSKINEIVFTNYLPYHIGNSKSALP